MSSISPCTFSRLVCRFIFSTSSLLILSLYSGTIARRVISFSSGQVHCSFVMGKARVTPLKPVTIPRLELTAALLSVRISASLREELEYDRIAEVFYTDSQVVLGYIKNDARRFHVFVANRVQQIRDNSTPDQWKYIETKENPTDESSHGLSPQDLIDSRWLNGPPFLWQP